MKAALSQQQSEQVPLANTQTPFLLSKEELVLADAIKKKQIKIFISYAWRELHSFKEIADEIYSHLHDLLGLDIIKDTSPDTGMVCGTNIERFMENAESAEIAILLINEGYLESRNCMYEMLKARGREFARRVIIVIHPESKLFGRATNVTHYVSHWERIHAEIEADMQKIVRPELRRNHERELEFVSNVMYQIGDIITDITGNISFDFNSLKERQYLKLLKQIAVQADISLDQQAALTQNVDATIVDEEEESPPVYTCVAEVEKLNRQAKASIDSTLGQLSVGIKSPTLKQVVQGSAKDFSKAIVDYLDQYLIGLELLASGVCNPPLGNAKDIDKAVKLRFRLVAKLMLCLSNDLPFKKACRGIYNSLPDYHYRRCFYQEMISWGNDQHKAKLEAFFQKLNQELEYIPSSDGYRLSSLRKENAWMQALFAVTDPFPEDGAVPQSAVCVEGAALGRRILKDEVKEQIFNPLSSSFQDDYQFGISRIARIEYQEYDICAKLCPEFPGIEVAAHHFAELVVGMGTTEVEFCKFSTQNGDSFPVLLSNTVQGDNLQGKIKQTKPNNYGQLEEEFNRIDSKSFSQLFLLSLLLSNEDAKPDNWLLTVRENAVGEPVFSLVAIDNDRSFLPPVVKKQGAISDYFVLQMKNFLFCMEQMRQPVNADVASEFCSLDIFSLLSQWNKRLAQENKRYLAMFSSEEIRRYYKSSGEWKAERPVLIPIAFTPDAIDRLYSKMRNIQLLWANKSGITHAETFSRVEKMAGKEYLNYLHWHKSPVERWNFIKKRHYKIDSKGNTVSNANTLTLVEKSGIIPQSVDVIELANSGQLYSLEFFLHRIKYLNPRRETLLNGEQSAFDGLNCDFIKEMVVNSIRFKHLNKIQQLNVFNAI